jgi:hypothetical protein
MTLLTFTIIIGVMWLVLCGVLLACTRILHDTIYRTSADLDKSIAGYIATHADVVRSINRREYEP